MLKLTVFYTIAKMKRVWEGLISIDSNESLVSIRCQWTANESMDSFYWQYGNIITCKKNLSFQMRCDVMHFSCCDASKGAHFSWTMCLQFSHTNLVDRKISSQPTRSISEWEAFQVVWFINWINGLLNYIIKL